MDGSKARSLYPSWPLSMSTATMRPTAEHHRLYLVSPAPTSALSFTLSCQSTASTCGISILNCFLQSLLCPQFFSFLCSRKNLDFCFELSTAKDCSDRFSSSATLLFHLCQSLPLCDCFMTFSFS